MAIGDYLTGANMKYVGIGIGIIVVIFFLLRFLKGGGWTRQQEEKEEIAQERDLSRTTKNELKLQRKEKKDLRSLIGHFTSLLEHYALLVQSIESTGIRKTGLGQASLTPEEILKVIQTIISMLNSIKRENTTLGSEESTFDKTVGYWNIAFKEINAWAYVPKQRSMSNYQKATANIQEVSKKINDKIVELGVEFRQEYQFDQEKKAEILKLYGKVVKEQGNERIAA